ncbi:hypothetical protein SAMN05216563_109193 [Phytobacter palmae]|nr:hypothetical protein SAMN05216563_109193 [Phytobacter palmae]
MSARLSYLLKLKINNRKLSALLKSCSDILQAQASRKVVIDNPGPSSGDLNERLFVKPLPQPKRFINPRKKWLKPLIPFSLCPAGIDAF